ncbi:hypothetical protein BJ741DRAFT_213949 [Chytriomyces cf. hyalinus JEL632]|nr:hypothetical protein BJ741DRAFT_213949 [Chytriomyces cf. hyalinus JEL632]
MRLTFIATVSTFAIAANAEARVPSFNRRADNATIATANATVADLPKSSETTTTASAVTTKNETSPATKSSSSASSKPSNGDFEVPKSSKNSYLTIINPLEGTVHNCGEAVKITWSAINAGNDKFFDETISLYLVDASNYKDAKVVRGGSFPGEVAIKNLKAEVTIPKLPSGKNYAIKVSYKDTTKYVDWYSTVFEIRCSDGSSPVSDVKATSAGGGGSAVPATAAVTTENKSPSDIAKSASQSVSAVSFVSLIAAFLL